MTIDVETLRKSLCSAFCSEIGVGQLDQETASIAMPLVGRDGDHIVAYAKQIVGGWRISDKGATLMRLSYENDLTKLLTGARERLFNTVLQESGVEEEDGELKVDVPADALPAGIFALGQSITRIEDLGLWTRSRVESAFYDDLRSIITGAVPSEDWVENYVVPNLPNADAYPIDHFIKTPSRPLYLFGVLNKEKAMLTTIILQHLMKHSPSFDSMVVYADIDDIPKPHARRLMNAANDVVPSIHDVDVIRQKIEHRRAA